MSWNRHRRRLETDSSRPAARRPDSCADIDLSQNGCTDARGREAEPHPRRVCRERHDACCSRLATSRNVEEGRETSRTSGSVAEESCRNETQSCVRNATNERGRPRRPRPANSCVKRSTTSVKASTARDRRNRRLPLASPRHGALASSCRNRRPARRPARNEARSLPRTRTVGAADRLHAGLAPPCVR